MEAFAIFVLAWLVVLVLILALFVWPEIKPIFTPAVRRRLAESAVVLVIVALLVSLLSPAVISSYARAVQDPPRTLSRAV